MELNNDTESHALPGTTPIVPIFYEDPHVIEDSCTMAAIDNAGKGKAKKQSNFSAIEVEQIAKSWLTCSGCSAVGAQQKSEVYWTKIEQHFRRAMSDYGDKFPGQIKIVPRSLRSLQSKWSEINHDCAKFSGAMSTIVELNESGTNLQEQMEKAKALYQQTSKKGAEFTMEGAWTILKDSPKWQIAARLNDKHIERRAKRRASINQEESNSPVDCNQNDNLSSAPEIVSDRPVGNKKAKHLAALEKKITNNKNQLADGTHAIAAALRERGHERAAAMKSLFEMQLFSININNLDASGRDFIAMKRRVAEMELRRQMTTMADPTDELPRSVDKENSDPNIVNVDNCSPESDFNANVDFEQDEGASPKTTEGHMDAAPPSSMNYVPEGNAGGTSFENELTGTLQYQDTRELYKWM